MNSLVPVTFRFPTVLTPAAQRVSLIGPFNGWTPRVHPLAKAGDYWWTITVYVPAGRVVYLFEVDGITWLDPQDDGRIPNGWGSEYSVRNIESIP